MGKAAEPRLVSKAEAGVNAATSEPSDMGSGLRKTPNELRLPVLLAVMYFTTICVGFMLGGPVTVMIWPAACVPPLGLKSGASTPKYTPGLSGSSMIWTKFRRKFVFALMMPKAGRAAGFVKE